MLCVAETVEEEVCDCKVHSLKCRKGIYGAPRETGDADETGASQGARAAVTHLGEMLLLLYEFLLTSLGLCRQSLNLGPSSQRPRAGSSNNFQMKSVLIMPFSCMTSSVVQISQLFFILHCCFLSHHLTFCISCYHSFLRTLAEKLFSINATIIIKKAPSPR